MENKDLNNKIFEKIKASKENPFKVPENYFEDFSSRLQEKIDSQKILKDNKPRIKFFNSAFKIAASLILIAAISFLIVKYTNNTKENNKYNIYAETIETSEFDLYNNLDENTIIDIIVEEDITLSDVNIEDDEIIEYLAYNTNYETIIEEY